MSLIKPSYPSVATSSPTFTSLVSLASSSTLVAGAESILIDNTSNLDSDHLYSAKIKVNTGTPVTLNTNMELWVVKPIRIAAGPTYTWPDVFGGADATRTLQSVATKMGMCGLLWSQLVDATTVSLFYYCSGRSVKALFNGEMPQVYSLFFTHNTGQTLAGSGSFIDYERMQRQIV